MDKGEDFIVANTLAELVDGMNEITGDNLVKLDDIERQVIARDREMDNKFTKDLQITALRGARKYVGDKLVRVAAPHQVAGSEKRTVNCCSFTYCQPKDAWRSAN